MRFLKRERTGKFHKNIMSALICLDESRASASGWVQEGAAAESLAEQQAEGLRMGRPRQAYFTLRTCLMALALLAAPLLAACAANSYAGISFAPGAADSELQALARRAQAGDKHAQLELGIRYEEGRGVAVDLARAERLYRMAASDSGGPIQVYSPPVGRQSSGQITSLNRGNYVPGLEDAKARLRGIQARKARQNTSIEHADRFQ
jgi:TPR repeat protein